MNCSPYENSCMKSHSTMLRFWFRILWFAFLNLRRWALPLDTNGRVAWGTRGWSRWKGIALRGSNPRSALVPARPQLSQHPAIALGTEQPAPSALPAAAAPALPAHPGFTWLSASTLRAESRSLSRSCSRAWPSCSSRLSTSERAGSVPAAASPGGCRCRARLPRSSRIVASLAASCSWRCFSCCEDSWYKVQSAL